jgi:hypothetical protein
MLTVWSSWLMSAAMLLSPLQFDPHLHHGGAQSGALEQVPGGGIP